MRRLKVRIREVRLAKGWSQKELARRMGLACATVCRQEREGNNITLRSLERYAKVLGCDVLDLVEEVSR